MTLWLTVIGGCLLAYLLKLAGYIVPGHLLSGPRLTRITTMLPVALLAALLAIQAFTGPGGAVQLDARVAGVAVAVVALVFRAPFIVVVLLGAAAAALLRHFGWG